MNLHTRIYNFLQKKPNEWVPESEVIKRSVALGYGAKATASILEDLSKSNTSHARMIERAKKRNKEAYYRWTLKNDLQKSIVDGLAWFDSIECSCQKCSTGDEVH